MKRIRRSVVFSIVLPSVGIALLISGCATLFAQEAKPALLLPAQLRADLDELVAKVSAVHPIAIDGLPNDFTAAVDMARNAAATPRSGEQWWVILSRVLTSLKDGHSFMNYLPSRGKQLDLPFVWLGDGIIVTHDAGPLMKGDRVIRIAERSESELMEMLRDIVPAENDHWVRHRGEHFLKSMPVLRGLGLSDAAPVPMTVERDGSEKAVTVALATQQRSVQNQRPWVRYKIDKEHDLGVFTLDQCTYNDRYRKMLEEFFAAVRKNSITRIAVDVRNNQGGSSKVMDRFLENLDVPSYGHYGVVVRWSAEARAQVGLLALFNRGVTRSAPRPKINRRVAEPYSGKVYVLTSKTTFSGGNWFALLLQENDLGTVVGEPTGNAPTSYGDRLMFTLPESGLTYGLSYKLWIRPDPSNDPADMLQPDVLIETTRKHIGAGVDPVLDHLRLNK